MKKRSLTRTFGGAPLYYKVMRVLKEQIVSGGLRAGDRLPSESELTETFGVSRVVVRRALKLIEEEGYIDRIKGKGTFVASHVENDGMPRLSGYLEDLIRIGLEHEVKNLDLKLVKASGEVAEVFDLPEGSDLFFFKRLRMIDGHPFSVVHNYIPYELGQLISPKELEDYPLMHLIETRAGVAIDWASEVFQAVAADQEHAELLEIDLMAPVLKMILTAYAVGGATVNLAHVYYRSDRYNYRGYLKRRRTGDSSSWYPVERALDEDLSQEAGSA